MQGLVERLNSRLQGCADRGPGVVAEPEDVGHGGGARVRAGLLLFCVVPTTSTPVPASRPRPVVRPSSSTTLSSTSVPSTPTSEAGGDSSTTPSTASVLGATISATPSTAPEVLDTSVGRSGPTRVGGLALTGAAVNVLFVAGLVTLLVGLALVMLPRRRSGN